MELMYNEQNKFIESCKNTLCNINERENYYVMHMHECTQKAV